MVLIRFSRLSIQNTPLSWNFFAMIDPPLKQNERVLSSQALNVGRSLGISSKRANFTFNSDVHQDVHVHLLRCLENPQSVKYFMHDRSLIMQLTNWPWRWSKTTKQSVIYGASTREFCGYRTWRKNYCKRQCVGMEIPCRLVFSCSSKVKINCLKELFGSKIRR